MEEAEDESMEQEPEYFPPEDDSQEQRQESKSLGNVTQQLELTENVTLEPELPEEKMELPELPEIDSEQLAERRELAGEGCPSAEPQQASAAVKSLHNSVIGALHKER